MIVNNLQVSNLFSYVNSTVFLGRYNVITGHNGVGKSNLIRILKRLIYNHGDGFSVSYIEDYEKFDKNDNSWINMSISLLHKESELISKFIFSKSTKNLNIDFHIIKGRFSYF